MSNAIDSCFLMLKLLKEEGKNRYPPLPKQKEEMKR